MESTARQYCYSYPHPAVTTDVVLFTIRGGALMLLLIRRQHPPYAGHWALPGGFVAIDEPLEQAAARELAEETGVRDIYLEQLYTFGRPDRDPRERVVSVAYFALLPEASAGVDVRAGSDAGAVGWFPVRDLPPLAFDHEAIVELAHRRLMAKLEYSDIAMQLLPLEFTLSQLQGVYEAILGRALDKRNFRRRITAHDYLEPTEAYVRNGNHRPARLYRRKAPAPGGGFN